MELYNGRPENKEGRLQRDRFGPRGRHMQEPVSVQQAEDKVLSAADAR